MDSISPKRLVTEERYDCSWALHKKDQPQTSAFGLIENLQNNQRWGEKRKEEKNRDRSFKAGSCCSSTTMMHL